MELKIKIETHNHKRYAVARLGGRFAGPKRAIAGTGLKKIDFVSIFKQNGTFDANIKRTRLTNVTEMEKTIKVSDVSKPPKKPRGYKEGQFVVKGRVNKEMIVGRSLKLGSVLCETEQKCIEYAFNKFYLLIGEKVSGNYNADEGMRAIDQNKIKNMRYGWVRYK
jgi:hypothetical protein